MNNRPAYPCSKCNELFFVYRDFENHMKSVHKKVKIWKCKKAWRYGDCRISWPLAGGGARPLGAPEGDGAPEGGDMGGGEEAGGLFAADNPEGELLIAVPGDGISYDEDDEVFSDTNIFPMGCIISMEKIQL